MRIPERCPWCGAEEVALPADELTGSHYAAGFRRVAYACDASYIVVGIDADRVFRAWPPCDNGDTPAAKAYRETLAWRKRLSQHTGVKLRLVPEHVACETLDFGHMIICDLGGCDLLAVCVGCKEPGDNGIDLMVCDGKKFVWRSWDGASRDSIRAEARRRLLAMGGEM